MHKLTSVDQTFSLGSSPTASLPVYHLYLGVPSGTCPRNELPSLSPICTPLVLPSWPWWPPTSQFLKSETSEPALISSSILRATARQMPSPKPLESTKRVFICSCNTPVIIHYHLCISLLPGLPTSPLFMSTSAFSTQEPKGFFKHKNHIMSLLYWKYPRHYPLYLKEIQIHHCGPEPLQDQASIGQCLHPHLTDVAPGFPSGPRMYRAHPHLRVFSLPRKHICTSPIWSCLFFRLQMKHWSPSVMVNFMCLYLTGSRGAQICDQALYWMFLWGWFWICFTFKSTDWVKRIALPNMGGPQPGSWRSKQSKKADPALSKSKFLLPDCLQEGTQFLSSLWAGTETLRLPRSWACGPSD